VTLDGVRIAVWHGRPGDDMRGIYTDDMPDARAALDRAECDVLVVGHTHLAFALAVDRRLIVNPGPLLRTPPPDTAEVVILGGRAKLTPSYGSYGVLETGSRTFTVHTLTRSP
jgi:predicted phosphodiesterase